MNIKILNVIDTENHIVATQVLSASEDMDAMGFYPYDELILKKDVKWHYIGSDTDGVVFNPVTGEPIYFTFISELPLPDNVIEQAYREQLENYRTMDAKAQLYDFLGYNIDEGADNRECLNSFKQKYGFNLEEAVNPESIYYLLDCFVLSYKRSLDCNIAENDLWQEVIRNELHNLEEKRKAS